MFSFLIATQITRKNALDVEGTFTRDHKVTATEWMWFLRDTEAGKAKVRFFETQTDLDTFAEAAKKAGKQDQFMLCVYRENLSWMDPAIWMRLQMLEEFFAVSGITCFNGLCESISVGAEEDWRRWFKEEDANEDSSGDDLDLPCGWSNMLSVFQQMILLRALKENTLNASVRKFVMTVLGVHFTRSPTGRITSEQGETFILDHRALGRCTFPTMLDSPSTNTGRAPSASTCYYNIHIPNYATREILEDKLREAIVAPEGFDLE